ncbi:MAG TPA: hypothetical protein VHZ05_10660 [Acidimicrobiales bacterium]|jgi:hypothetical protein|nr:hypothetical protein [Acidimicrobiales bacterium]
MPDNSRPKLVLLRPTEDASAADVDDDEGCHYERIGVLDRPETVCLPEMGADLRDLRRDQARRRFSVLLRCLGGVALSTFIIGLLPGMHLTWVFTALTGLPALALLGLMAYANEVKEERRRRGARRSEAGVDAVGYIDPASAGYPGAWDDDEPFEEPQAAAR